MYFISKHNFISNYFTSFYTLDFPKPFTQNINNTSYRYIYLQSIIISCGCISNLNGFLSQWVTLIGYSLKNSIFVILFEIEALIITIMVFWECFHLAKVYIIQEHTFGQRTWDKLRYYLGIIWVHVVLPHYLSRMFICNFVDHYYYFRLLQELWFVWVDSYYLMHKPLTLFYF